MTFVDCWDCEHSTIRQNNEGFKPAHVVVCELGHETSTWKQCEDYR